MSNRTPDTQRRPTPALAERKGGPRIPVEPFVKWCEMKLVQYGGPSALKMYVDAGGRLHGDATGARDQLAEKLGVATRTLWRYIHHVDSCGRPTTVAPRWYVEDMLAHAGVDFYSVYPEFLHERDVELAAEAWCRCCREFINPVDGRCLWCDTPVNALDVAA